MTKKFSPKTRLFLENQKKLILAINNLKDKNAKNPDSTIPEVKKVCVLPKKPSPIYVYYEWRMEALLALGNTKDQVFQICSKEYKHMSERQKLSWIVRSLEKESVYKVFF